VAYRSRIVDAELALLLGTSGAVLIEGAKACGKTETAMQVAASSVQLDIDAEARAAAAVDPGLVLSGDRPRLIDEWQLIPGVWDHVRRAVDRSGRTGEFILTGSAVPADDVTRHTGAGRFTRLRMRPMSLFESGHSSGESSLRSLLEGRDPAGRSDLDTADLAVRVSVGGWPGLLDRTPAQVLRVLRGYLDDVRRTDISRLDGIRRDPENVARVLRSLARHSATEASDSTIAADIGGSEGSTKRETVAAYHDALGRLMIIEDLPAWAPSLRSRTTLRQAPVRHFVDPSLAVAALGASPDRLVRDLRLLEQLFESLVVRDLRIYAQANDAEVFRYRDHTGLEMDAILQRRDGGWAAIEVKLGVGQVDDAAHSLLRLAERVASDPHGAPLLLAVVIGRGIAHRRPDGVLVIPVGTLGP